MIQFSRVRDTKAYRKFTLGHYFVGSADGVDTIRILGRKSVVKDPEQNLTSRDAWSSRAGNFVRCVTPCPPITAARPGEGQYTLVRGRQQTNGVDVVEGALT